MSIADDLRARIARRDITFGIAGDPGAVLGAEIGRAHV